MRMLNISVLLSMMRDRGFLGKMESEDKLVFVLSTCIYKLIHGHLECWTNLHRGTQHARFVNQVSDRAAIKASIIVLYFK